MTEKLDPRIKRTRQLIRQAMMTLMQKKHFQDITVQEITGEAGINRATFYAHFVDKQALMNYTIREMLQERIDSQLPAHPALTPENLRLLIVTVSEFMVQTVNHCSPVRDDVQPLIEAEIQAHLAGVIQFWMAQSPLRESIPADTAALVLSWSIFGAALEWSRDKKQTLSAGQLADRLLPLIAAGIFPNSAKS
jgi:AcrR family transcriptional regulator